jgi:hypothetical protein
MPAYSKDSNVVCFFQSSAKFKTRYATLGFSGKANLDEGCMWPTAYSSPANTSRYPRATFSGANRSRTNSPPARPIAAASPGCVNR